MNSTTPHQSQQTQQLPMIIPPTPVHSLRPTAVGMVSPGMVPHVPHPQATMPPTHPLPPMAPIHPMPPIRPVHSTGWGYPRYGGGGGQYGMMPGQYVNQIQTARPSGMEMNMVQQPALPHMIPSYNSPMGAGVQLFSNLGAAMPQSSLMSLDPTLRTSSEQSVSPQQLTPPPSQQLHTPPPPPPPPPSTPQMFQTQTWTRPHDPAAHLTPLSTPWLVSESFVYVNSFNQGL